MSLALSSSNRSQLTYKLEGTYPTNFGVLQGGNGIRLNMTSETFDFSVKTEKSKQIREDRSVADIIQVGASSQGGFAFEAQYDEYDPFIEGVLQGTFTAYGTAGISTASTGTLTITSPTVLTASVAYAAANVLTSLERGQWFTLIPHVSASDAVKLYLASRPFRLSATVAPSATVLTLDAATPINTAIISAPLAIGWRLSSSRLSNGNTMRSYSFEVQHADIGQFRQYLGMIASKMDLKLSVGSILTGAFEFMGRGFNLVQSSGMGATNPAMAFTPANATRGVFDILENGVSVSATTYIKSADISIDNSLRMQDAVGFFGAAGIGAGTLDASLKLEVYFANAAIYNKLLNNTATSLTIPVLDVDGNGYIYFFPRMRYTTAKVGTGGQDQDNMLAMDATALPDITPGSATLGSTVVVYRVGVAVV